MYIYTTIHIIADKSEPSGAASPIGKRLSGKNNAAKYAPGTRTKRIDAALWKKETIDLPTAQKYPLKQK